MNLSDKMFIHEAIEILKYQKKPIDYVVQSLMNEKNLTTYFDVNVTATESTGYEMQPINEDGDELPYVNGQPPIEIEGPDKKILEAYVDGKNTISVYRFEHGGKPYCGSDNEGTNLKPIVLGFDDIYFNKSEVPTHQELPPYLDKEHEHYAPELDLAIQLHQAIFVEKYGNQGHQREDRVIKWLGENYKNHGFRDAKIKRLSSIIGVKKLKEKK
jgi:hypothetical protein